MEINKKMLIDDIIKLERDIEEAETAKHYLVRQKYHYQIQKDHKCICEIIHVDGHYAVHRGSALGTRSWIGNKDTFVEALRLGGISSHDVLHWKVK